MKLFRALQLKTGNFKDRPGGVGALLDQGDDGNANIAPHQSGKPCSLKNLAQQSSGGRLTVGASDGQRLAFEEARGKFQFPDNGQPEITNLGQLRCIEWHRSEEHTSELQSPCNLV